MSRRTCRRNARNLCQTCSNAAQSCASVVLPVKAQAVLLPFSAISQSSPSCHRLVTLDILLIRELRPRSQNTASRRRPTDAVIEAENCCVSGGLAFLGGALRTCSISVQQSRHLAESRREVKTAPSASGMKRLQARPSIFGAWTTRIVRACISCGRRVRRSVWRMLASPPLSGPLTQLYTGRCVNALEPGLVQRTCVLSQRAELEGV
ncbi:hypothetical protein BV25DRAFT_1028774 [Artomyces pyxidatus]|uniref:Uncharacterized protein n=1 Tax=Artomyces pyxidatus TaxID=48021 RepID=A0ACB8SVF5_9AGAM|nr:hypothetical protein BV25DRAFT_1028774 [Artomyces pyxidatus]